MPALNSFENQWFGVDDWVERQKTLQMAIILYLSLNCDDEKMALISGCLDSEESGTAH